MTLILTDLKLQIFLIIITVLSLISLREVEGAFEERVVSPRAFALGRAYAALHSTQHTLLGNAANIAAFKTFNFGAFYARPYGLKELSQSGISLVVPSRAINVAFSASRFGFSLYRENEFSVGIAREITTKFQSGFVLRYMTLDIDGYGAANVISFNAGFLFQASKNFTLD